MAKYSVKTRHQPRRNYDMAICAIMAIAMANIVGFASIMF